MMLLQNLCDVISLFITFLDDSSLLGENLVNVFFSDLPFEIHYFLLHYIL